jgi:hypothetical protein
MCLDSCVSFILYNDSGDWDCLMYMAHPPVLCPRSDYNFVGCPNSFPLAKDQQMYAAMGMRVSRKHKFGIVLYSRVFSGVCSSLSCRLLLNFLNLPSFRRSLFLSSPDE